MSANAGPVDPYRGGCSETRAPFRGRWSAMTRWTPEQHAAWRDREARRMLVGAPGAGAVVDTHKTPPPVVHPSVALVLPMPPSVNDLYRTDPRTGYKYLTDDQCAFRSYAIQIAQVVRGNAGPLPGRLEMRVTLYFLNRRRTDISNRLKALEDALTHARVYVDDSQIDVLTVQRVIIRKGGSLTTECCAVNINEVSP